MQFNKGFLQFLWESTLLSTEVTEGPNSFWIILTVISSADSSQVDVGLSPSGKLSNCFCSIVFELLRSITFYGNVINNYFLLIRLNVYSQEDQTLPFMFRRRSLGNWKTGGGFNSIVWCVMHTSTCYPFPDTKPLIFKLQYAFQSPSKHRYTKGSKQDIYLLVFIWYFKCVEVLAALLTYGHLEYYHR